ncbi:MAG: hypothetical protein IT436_01815 [Phycisphaerales bacterium]|nr:hypothetical protein [Phycisphaerales bacterium]
MDNVRMGGVAVCALVMFAGGAGPALAEPLVDNLDQPIRDVTILGTVEPDVLWAAQSFYTPARASLNTVTAMVGWAADGTDAVAELRMGDDPTGPVVTTFTVPAMSGITVEPAVFVPDAAVTLEPGVQYWVVMGPASAGSFGWAYAEGDAYTGPGWFGGYTYSSDYGVSWISIGIENPHQIGVDVTFITCLADLNGDGLVDFADYLEFLNLYDAGDPRVDFNQDGLVDFSDYLEFLNLYDAGC